MASEGYHTPMRPSRPDAHLLLYLATSLALAACPEGNARPDGREEAKARACTKAYEKCELGNGALGVCDIVDCAPGTPEPCLRCRSQH